MQTLTGQPRHLLTDAQVLYLIEEPDLTIGFGADLLSQDLVRIADISEWLAGGVVERHNYATLHGSCELQIRTELDWARAIVRPYMTLTDGVIFAQFNLGAYYTNVPERDVGDDRPVNVVQGFDILHGLNDPVGEAYAVPSGTTYLSAVEEILVARGFSRYLIDQGAMDKALPIDRVWVFDENTTWIHVVNDLLGSIGYQGIWSDWDGNLRCEKYLSPLDRAPEWTYHTDPITGMMSRSRIIKGDFFDSPNRWVFYRQNNVEDDAPVEGNGIYTYVNDTIGPTSVSARGGRVVTKIQSRDVADHQSLVDIAQVTIDADLRLNRTIAVRTSPNPLHWHFDRMFVNDPGLGLFDVQSTSWTLPLDGSLMTHEWSVIDV